MGKAEYGIAHELQELVAVDREVEAGREPISRDQRLLRTGRNRESQLIIRAATRFATLSLYLEGHCHAARKPGPGQAVAFSQNRRRTLAFL